MNEQVRLSIQQTLGTLEIAENIVVLLAVESGSRAWGFESSDSDYDVRFIYIRRPEWYLTIDLELKRDVIERPLQDEIDLSGWDVRKALWLFQKSNPPLLEWLQSPIIYRERFSFAARLRQLLPEFYSPRACFYHYLHMARGNIREYLHGETVRQKKYFYVLRPLLAMRWIEQELGPVPIEFQKLVLATINDVNLRAALDGLVAAKRAGAELDHGPRIPAISDFIAGEMARLESIPANGVDSSQQIERLNQLFRATIEEIWDNQQQDH
jgi:uncharacterized protein